MHGGAALLALLLCLGAAAPAQADSRAFPKPPALEARVAFWKRVYTEIGTDKGFLHDAEDLRIVYGTITLPKNSGPRRRSRYVNAEREKIEAALQRLARGRSSGLSRLDMRVRALFPRGVPSKRLWDAARNVRFQLGQADKFRAGLERQGHWQGLINDVFDAQALPLGLAALPHVESSFNPKALSHKGASGLWQFTRSTGRLFMRIDHVVDERKDPLASTQAAAKLLKRNHQRLGTWPLAITAYNHGATGMARAVRRLGTRDITRIIERYRSRTFGFASRNFYASFLAAREIDQDPAHYFGRIDRETPEQLEAVKLDHYYRPASLARAYGIAESDLKRMNPALLEPVWRGEKYIPKDYVLRIPPEDLSDGDSRATLAVVPSSERYHRQLLDTRYRVRLDDTLERIARRFGVRQQAIMAMNPGLRNPHRIYPGQVLNLPVKNRNTSLRRVAYQARPASGVYRVRRGDSLDRIARRFGMSAREIATLNHLPNPNRIRTGQRLRLPGGGTSRASSATRVHQVRRGETLARIARRYAVRQSDILALNRLRSPDLLRVGQRLRLPGGGASRASSATRVHQVRRGETLARIARRYAVRQSDILALNRLRSPDLLRVGQRLRLPGGGARSYIVRRGDTLDKIARRHRVSQRAIQQINHLPNPDRIQIGQVLNLP